MFSYEYNTPIHFDGDIIITDPCYIMNKNNEDHVEYPSWWNYISLTKTEVKANGSVIYHMPKHSDYPDARIKNFEDYLLEENGRVEMAKCRMNLDYRLNKTPMFSPTLYQEWKNYYEVEKRYQDTPHDDWDICLCGGKMEALGLTTFLCASTIYGDWSCTTYNIDTKEKIVEFCADSGQVGVFLLDQVIKYNPNFDYHINRPWTTTLIKDFHGTVELKKDTVYDADGDEIKVIGTGNINFKGIQTGF